MNERILELARAVSGAGEGETALLETLCAAAETAWTARLRQNITAADCGEAFVCAAAFTAAADLAARRGGEQVSGFTAGEITIRGKSAGETAHGAAELRRTAERLMEPYAAPGDFCFLGGAGMTDWTREALERYGQHVTLKTPEGPKVLRAFLQPITKKGERVPEVITGIGWVDGRLWLYLGDREIRPGDGLAWNGMEFRVRSSRPYYIGDTLNHWWAVLEQAREAAE